MTFAPTHPGPPAPEKKPLSAWRRIWRLLYWLSILAAVWTVVLVLRPAPVPQIAVNPQAAHSAEVKLQGLASSSVVGEAHKITLTEEELNSYLSSHLALSPGGGNSSSGPSIENLKTSVRDVKVSLQGDRARAFVVFHLAGK